MAEGQGPRRIDLRQRLHRVPVHQRQVVVGGVFGVAGESFENAPAILGSAAAEDAMQVQVERPATDRLRDPLQFRNRLRDRWQLQLSRIVAYPSRMQPTDRVGVPKSRGCSVDTEVSVASRRNLLMNRIVDSQCKVRY